MSLVYWCGTPKCDFDPAHDLKAGFYDAPTIVGAWALMCPLCFEHLGKQGGAGARYEQAANGRYVKVEAV